MLKQADTDRLQIKLVDGELVYNYPDCEGFLNTNEPLTQSQFLEVVSTVGLSAGNDVSGLGVVNS